MSEISKIVVYYADGTTQEVGSGEVSEAAKVRVEFRRNRTKDGAFKPFGPSNGDEFLASKVKDDTFFARYRITALKGNQTVRRVDVSRNQGLRINGIREGVTIEEGESRVFDVHFGPLEPLHVGHNDQAWFEIETKESGVIVKDGVRIIAA